MRPSECLGHHPCRAPTVVPVYPSPYNNTKGRPCTYALHRSKEHGSATERVATTYRPQAACRRQLRFDDQILPPVLHPRVLRRGWTRCGPQSNGYRQSAQERPLQPSCDIVSLLSLLSAASLLSDAPLPYLGDPTSHLRPPNTSPTNFRLSRAQSCSWDVLLSLLLQGSTVYCGGRHTRYTTARWCRPIAIAMCLYLSYVIGETLPNINCSGTRAREHHRAGHQLSTRRRILNFYRQRTIPPAHAQEVPPNPLLKSTQLGAMFYTPACLLPACYAY